MAYFSKVVHVWSVGANVFFYRLEHWDVNNELLHGQIYEDITGDPNYTQDIFRLVHQLDPGPKLFLNDYNVVSSGASTAVVILFFIKHIL